MMKKGLCFLSLGILLASCGGESDVNTVLTDVGVETADVLSSEEAETDLLAIQNKAIINVGGTVGADAGFISDGGTIAVPTGFTGTIANCVMTVSPALVDGSAISTQVSVNTGTGVVTCRKVTQERDQVPAQSKSCVASYTIICLVPP